MVAKGARKEIDLDDKPYVICGEAVSEDALDEKAEHFDVYKKLECLREVGPRKLEELSLYINISSWWNNETGHCEKDAHPEFFLGRVSELKLFALLSERLI